MSDDLAARVDRLESIDEIRQLVAKYALSLDMRDLDAHVNLFAPDIRVSREKVGRAHLKRWLDDTLRLQFTGTAHHVGNHVIEFDDADHAHGVVYSKNEHETGDQWVIMQMLYWDDAARRRRATGRGSRSPRPVSGVHATRHTRPENPGALNGRH